MAEEIIVSPGDLPEVKTKFGFVKGDLTEARVRIHGELAERLEKDKVKDEESIGIKAPSGGEGALLQLVVTTNSDRIMGILNYRWNEEGKKWQIQKPNPDVEGMDDGLSPVVTGIGDVVTAIHGLTGGTSTTPTGGTATTTAGEATTTAGGAGTTTAGEVATPPKETRQKK
jgi:hypothetical protein